MNRELAHHFAYEAYLTSTRLSDLMEFIGHYCDDEAEYKFLSEKVATIQADIGNSLLSQIYSQYPEIELEIKEKVKKYGILVL